jgi:hypothetical protein
MDSRPASTLVLAWAVCLLVMPDRAVAQTASNRSGLHGRVTDQTGSVIAGATIALSGGPRQIRTATNQRGQYAFADLDAGKYTVTISMQGFRPWSQRIELRPALTTTLDITLAVAVEVSLDVKEPPGLSTDPRKDASALVLTGRDLDALPDDPQRLYLRLLELAGSTGRPGDVAVYIDGFREYKRLPPKNIIEMVRINSNPFSAEFAQPSLRRIEITTKSGADSFHGDLRLQARAGLLDAAHPLTNTTSAMQYRSYNGFLQGPIGDTPIGFLVYGGRWKQDDNAFVHATVLDANAQAALPFNTVVSTPIDTNAAMLKTDIKLANQLFNVSYTRTRDQRRNQGLQSGFSLPESGYNRTSTEQIGRLWWTSLGPRVVNDVRFEATRTDTAAVPLVAAPALLVFDAFNAGGNQDAASRTAANGVQASETVTAQLGNHMIKSGVLLEGVTQSSADRSGFGGTYIFGADIERDANGEPALDGGGSTVAISPLENYRRTLAALPGYRPSQFSIVRGNPDVGVAQWHLGWFALDDWSLSRRLTFSFGVRQDAQTNIQRRINLAPRAALSWLVDQRQQNAIKLGAGIFYGRVDPQITLDTRKLNGVDRQQLIVQRPPFFTPVTPPLDSAIPIRPTIYTKSADLRVPTSIITSIAYERALPRGLFAVAQYQRAVGMNLLRLRNVTAAAPDPVNAALDPPVLQFESSGRSSQHELMLTLRGHVSAAFTFYGDYRFGTRKADTDGAYTAPADSQDLSAEYGAAADDQRHQFVAGFSAQLPAGITIDSSMSAASGRPFNITTGRDDNGDTIFTDRPSFAQPGDSGAVATAFGRFNPHPQPGDALVPRNFGRDPWLVNMNLAVTKAIGQWVFVSVDVENLFNAGRLFASNRVVTSPVFGLPNQALNPRRLEFTVRFSF